MTAKDAIKAAVTPNAIRRLIFLGTVVSCLEFALGVFRRGTTRVK
jgi:hypothetical protein